MLIRPLIRIYNEAAALPSVRNTDHWLPDDSNHMLLSGMYEYYIVEEWTKSTPNCFGLHREQHGEDWKEMWGRNSIGIEKLLPEAEIIPI